MIWSRPALPITNSEIARVLFLSPATARTHVSHAMAKLTFRLVPDQNGDEVLKLVIRHLEKHLPPGVNMEITPGHSGPWYLTDPHSPYGKAAQRALRQAFGKDPALIREGGSIPIVSQWTIAASINR